MSYHIEAASAGRYHCTQPLYTCCLKATERALHHSLGTQCLPLLVQSDPRLQLPIFLEQRRFLPLLICTHCGGNFLQCLLDLLHAAFSGPNDLAATARRHSSNAAIIAIFADTFVIEKPSHFGHCCASHRLHCRLATFLIPLARVRRGNSLEPSIHGSIILDAAFLTQATHYSVCFFDIGRRYLRHKYRAQHLLLTTKTSDF